MINRLSAATFFSLQRRMEKISDQQTVQTQWCNEDTDHFSDVLIQNGATRAGDNCQAYLDISADTFHTDSILPMTLPCVWVPPVHCIAFTGGTQGCAPILNLAQGPIVSIPGTNLGEVSPLSCYNGSSFSSFIPLRRESVVRQGRIEPSFFYKSPDILLGPQGEYNLGQNLDDICAQL